MKLVPRLLAQAPTCPAHEIMAKKQPRRPNRRRPAR